MQQFIVDLRESHNALRVYLKETKNIEFTYNMNVKLLAEVFDDRRNDHCTFVKTGENDIEVDVICDYSSVAQKKINNADAMALQQMESGIVLALSLYTSYSFEGAEKLHEMDPDSELRGRDLQLAVESIPTMGNLLAQESFTQVVGLGSDFKSAYLWVYRNQATLCPHGEQTNGGAWNYDTNQWDSWETPDNRPGYVVSGGFCVEKIPEGELQKNLTFFNRILAGVIEDELETPMGDLKVTKVNYFNLFRNPVKNIMDIAPSAYNSCDEAIALKDKTFGGTFPSNDAESFILRPYCDR